MVLLDMIEQTMLGYQHGKKIMDCQVIQAVNSTSFGQMASTWFWAVVTVKVGKDSKAEQSLTGMVLIGMFSPKADKMESKMAIQLPCLIVAVC